MASRTRFERGAVHRRMGRARIAALLPEDRYRDRTRRDRGERSRAASRCAGWASSAPRRSASAPTCAFSTRQPQTGDRRAHRLSAGRRLDPHATPACGRPTNRMLLMDAPRQPDGPPIRDGKSYSRIAHLAEDMVRPFVAIGAVAGERRPERAARCWHPTSSMACCWSRTWAIACSRPRSPRARRKPSCGAARSMCWCSCARCRCRRSLPLPDGSSYALPRRDRAAFEIELELLLDWYWPALKGAPRPPAVRAEFRGALERRPRSAAGAAGRLVSARLSLAQPDLAARARRALPGSGSSISRMRSTNTAAFDLVSLLQDARDRRASGARARLVRTTTAPGRRSRRRVSIGRPLRRPMPCSGRSAIRACSACGCDCCGATASHTISSISRAPGDISSATLRAAAMAALAPWYARHFPPHLRAGLPG